MHENLKQMLDDSYNNQFSDKADEQLIIKVYNDDGWFDVNFLDVIQYAAEQKYDEGNQDQEYMLNIFMHGFSGVVNEYIQKIMDNVFFAYLNTHDISLSINKLVFCFNNKKYSAKPEELFDDWEDL